MDYRVTALFRYPLKSGAGERCESFRLDRFGVQGDRRWMVTSPCGAPITQREVPEMALIRARIEQDGLTLAWKSWDLPTVRLPKPGPDATRLEVTIWGDAVNLPLADDKVTAWISDHLNRDARVAYMPREVERPVNPRYAGTDDRTALTDGYPLHLIGSGSMDDLNSRLAEPVGIERFRPNIFVECSEGFAEDTWERLRIGDCGFRVVRPCPRCSVTTVDPETGHQGKEPLRTLARYRKREGGVMFGQNLVHDGCGEIRVGDRVEVISRRDTPAA
ncbi:MAG: MOSC domain-containing protein [Gemmatimonadales bacterium]|nr:MAG: MOSC domain-containing protein [Gemmatimonadales bacterium]